jgi:hypothetical protein
MKLRWPRGRYNGQKIVGFKFSISIDILWWILAASWNFGEPYLFIGPLCFRAYAVYRLGERKG